MISLSYLFYRLTGHQPLNAVLDLHMKRVQESFQDYKLDMYVHYDGIMNSRNMKVYGPLFIPSIYTEKYKFMHVRNTIYMEESFDARRLYKQTTSGFELISNPFEDPKGSWDTMIHSAYFGLEPYVGNRGASFTEETMVSNTFAFLQGLNSILFQCNSNLLSKQDVIEEGDFLLSLSELATLYMKKLYDLQDCHWNDLYYMMCDSDSTAIVQPSVIELEPDRKYAVSIHKLCCDTLTQYAYVDTILPTEFDRIGRKLVERQEAMKCLTNKILCTDDMAKLKTILPELSYV